MLHEIEVGTVSWIGATKEAVVWAVDAKKLEPEWVPKTYMGLYATRNPPPPKTIDFQAYRGLKKFRAMMYCRIKVDVNEISGDISSFQVLEAFEDPGWTPPFSIESYPSTGVLLRRSIWGGKSYPGEASPLSLIRTQARHGNTAISVPAPETVLVDALIKFRAGKHTDDIGVKEVGSPFHVPWVWCELVLTYVPGVFRLYGRGSVLPSHAWYVNHRQFAMAEEVGDRSIPTKIKTISCVPAGPPGEPSPSRAGSCMEVHYDKMIMLSALSLYPVLTTGASARGGAQQIPLSADKGRSGSVDTHPHTVKGGPTAKFEFKG